MNRPLDINFTYVNQDDYKEKLPVIIASGDLPDLISLENLSQADILKDGDSGLFLDLNQYIDKMPNFKKLLDLAPHSAPNLLSKEGKLYAVYFFTTNNMAVDGGNDMAYVTGIRKDLFDKHNIAIPTTIDELTAAAVQLKKIYPDKYPIAPNSSWETPFNILQSTNHICNWDQYLFYDGSAWQYAPLTDRFKDAVVTMQLWVKEKLLTPDYMTFTNAQGTAAMAAGDAMILPGFWYGFPGYWETQYKDQHWVMVAGISNPKYGKPWVYNTYSLDDTSIIMNYAIAISAKSKYINEMVQFMDLQLTDDISNIVNWGIEGKTYTVTNGVKQFTDAFVQANTSDPGNATNPLNSANLALGNGTCRPGIFPNIQDALANDQGTPEQDNIVDGKLIRAKVTKIKKDSFRKDEQVPQSVVNMSPLSSDESNEYANIMTPVDTYAKAQVASFILGKRPISEWDKFLDEVKKMGDIQKALDIYTSHTTK